VYLLRCVNYSTESSWLKVGRHWRQEWPVLRPRAGQRATSNTHTVQDAVAGLGQSFRLVSMRTPKHFKNCHYVWAVKWRHYASVRVDWSTTDRPYGVNYYKCKKKLWFIHELTAHHTSKTTKITKRWLPTSTSPKCQCAVE